jgi:hypothetical protein
VLWQPYPIRRSFGATYPRTLSSDQLRECFESQDGRQLRAAAGDSTAFARNGSSAVAAEVRNCVCEVGVEGYGDFDLLEIGGIVLRPMGRVASRMHPTSVLQTRDMNGCEIAIQGDWCNLVEHCLAGDRPGSRHPRMAAASSHCYGGLARDNFELANPRQRCAGG